MTVSLLSSLSVVKDAHLIWRMIISARRNALFLSAPMMDSIARTTAPKTV